MVAIIDYKAGNIASVERALRFLGAECIVTDDAEAVWGAEKIVLPGVGHFSATSMLDVCGLRPAILESVLTGTPFLGICVGMQWMYQGSSESLETCGAAWIPGQCQRFTTGVKCPHVGWNTVRREGGSRLLHGIADEAFVYYSHSYSAQPGPGCVATSDYYGRFAAVLEKDNIFGVQFHPEKSAATGLRILQNFLEL